MALEQQASEEQGVTVVALSGQLDSRAAPDFEKALLKLIAEKKHEILLDLTALEYVASAGLRVFVMVGKRLHAEGGRLALCALNEGVMKVFEISGFVPLFPILPNRREAIPWLLANARAGRSAKSLTMTTAPTKLQTACACGATFSHSFNAPHSSDST